MKKLLVLIMILLLQACAFDSKILKPDAVVPPPEKVVHLDPRVLEPCKPLVVLAQPFSDDPFGDILINNQANAEIYSACAKKQDDAIILLKQFSNTKETK